MSEENTSTSTDAGQGEGEKTGDGTTSVLSPDSTDKGGETGSSTDAGGDSDKQGQTTGDQGSGDGDGDELEVKLPENVKIDEKLLDGFKGVAKEAGLDSDKASKVATFYAEQMKVAAKAQEDALVEQDKTWLGELKEDPDFGGKAFDDNAKHAARAVREYGGGELGKALQQAGLDNYPPLVKAFARVGRAMAEDSTGADKAKGQGSVTHSREDALSSLYNNS